MWFKLYLHQRGRCALCQEPMPLADATRDHIMPKSLGGKLDYENNVQLAHRACNEFRGRNYNLELASGFIPVTAYRENFYKNFV